MTGNRRLFRRSCAGIFRTFSTLIVLSTGLFLYCSNDSDKNHCNVDADCHNGAYCNANVCVSPSCKTTNDCLSGRKCWNSLCVASICAQDNGGCGADKVCQEDGDNVTCTCKTGFVPDGDQCKPSGVCVNTADTETNCGDGKDDDCNGLVDCEDPACQDKECGNGPADCQVKTCSAEKKCEVTLRKAGSVCRPAAGECDIAEICDGNSPDCPPENKFKADGTSCNDGKDCTSDDKCQGGTCGGTESCAQNNNSCSGHCDAAGKCAFDYTCGSDKFCCPRCTSEICQPDQASCTRCIRL